MTSGEHTKGCTELPWHFEELGPHRTADGCGYIRSQADNLEISHHGDMGRSREENLANANLIVTAVNTYPAVAELVKALEDSRSAIASLQEYALGGVEVEHTDGSGPAYQYPIRDELLSTIDSALTRFREAQAGGGA